jgi:N-acetylneuraminic acid mutarotase
VLDETPPLLARMQHTAVVISGGILVFGGFTANSSYLNDVWQYSFGKDSIEIQTHSKYFFLRLHGMLC